MKDETILINGMSKAYAMTGWRLGYAAGNKNVIKAMDAIQGHAVSHPSSITQYAGIAALNGNQSDVADMICEYERRRNYTVARLDAINELNYIKQQGAFYCFISLGKVIGRQYNGRAIDSSMTFCDMLLEHARVAAVPGKAFGDDGYIRISYATSMDMLEKGLNRIEEFIKKLD